MTENEKKGFELFKGKGLCSQCHILDIDKLANNVIFTDFTYDNLGIPKNTDSPFYNLDTSYNPDGKDYVDIGLMATTKREEDLGKFRVPTLRNIAKTAPYGHNGYFKDLASIVHFYNVRDVGDEFPPAECLSTVNKSELGNLGLTASEERYLIDFMNMLNDN
ncbi:MAG: cytochrome-c peroxidase [Bacteroidales bacterium]